MNEVRITMPMVPPNVNNYVKHTRSGIHYLTKEAKAFKEAFGLYATRSPWRSGVIPLPGSGRYEVEVTVFQGKGERGDVDNYSKCVLDGLVDAGVIYSDAAITDLTIRKRRDRENPRTEIIVREAA